MFGRDITMHQIRKEQKADEVVGEVRSLIEQGNKPKYEDIRGYHI